MEGRGAGAVLALPGDQAQAARLDLDDGKQPAGPRWHINAEGLGLPALRVWKDSSTESSTLLNMWDDARQEGPDHPELILPMTPNSLHITHGQGLPMQSVPSYGAESAGPQSARTLLHDLQGFGEFLATPRSLALLLPGDFDHQFSNPQAMAEALPSQLGTHHSMPLPTLQHLGFESLPPPSSLARKPAQAAPAAAALSRRFSQPALSVDRSADASPSDSPSDEEAKPSRKRRRAGGKRQTCSNCSTHQTPQWRCGPYGPRTLCNACGVRFKKGLPMDGIIAAKAHSGGGAAAAEAS